MKRLLGTVLAVLCAALSAAGAKSPVRDGIVHELKVYGKRAYKSPVKLDPKSGYDLYGEFRTDGNPAEIAFGIEFYDRNGDQIYPFMFTAFPETGTTLLESLKPGDT
ncbi:MAG: hypothetical protein IJJ28_03780, partial [Lentisphaeria bacterium]|nr:hypothetical protein [Lentisphaeria bacterium]